MQCHCFSLLLVISIASKKTGGGVCSFIVRRIKGLYLPYIKWSLVFLLMHNIFYHLNLYNGTHGFRVQVSHLYSWDEFAKKAFNIVFKMSDTEQLLGAFWFIRALFIASVSVALLHFIFRRIQMFNRFIILPFLLFLAYIATKYDIKLPWMGSLGLVLFSSFFFVAGFSYRKIESKKFYTYIAIFISTAVTFCGLLYFHQVTGVLGIKDEYIIPYSLVALSGILMVLNLSKWIEGYSIRSFLYYVGNNTMIILALHFISLKIVTLLKIWIYGWPIERLAEFPVIEENNTYWWILYSIVGTIIPIIVQLTYSKSKLFFVNNETA
ncbi:MAG: acyltransferase family protein [Prevotella sp.]|nr:acyltransferase family protein [Prevotella sp.]